MAGLIGTSLGSYRILEQIGVGGMATVYKAYQPGVDRYVAIKVLPPHLAEDPQFPRRFQREARAIAQLEHARILPVYDYGESEGITYIVMRYVEAGTLKEYMADGPLALAEIGRIIGQIGSALNYAHRQGIIHRDVKPGNVLIDSQGDAYLTDFGLARMMEGSQQFTATGVSLGTPAYMSPEQGKGLRADHRSDIYSLGVVLYEMVTGKVPYEADTPLAVMLKHITDPLPLPRTINPNVPEAIERIILTAMAREPEDRFQTMAEMVNALEAAVRQVTEEQPTQLPTEPAAPAPSVPSPSVPAGRWWRQTWSRIMLVGGLALISLLAILLASRSPGRVENPSPQTEPTAAATLTTAPGQAAAMPTETARPRAPLGEWPIGELGAGMGGEITIRGTVRDSSGAAAPNVYMTLSVNEDEAGKNLWQESLVTDQAGTYAFRNLLRPERGHYQVWLNGGEEYGRVYENSGYFVNEEEISGDEHVLDVTVYPVTGSELKAVISYIDADGETKAFLSTPLGRDHFIGLERGSSFSDHEYSIGSEYILRDESAIYLRYLAGGTYFLSVQFVRSDGKKVDCGSPAIEIPAGATTFFEYTIHEPDCSPWG